NQFRPVSVEKLKLRNGKQKRLLTTAAVAGGARRSGTMILDTCALLWLAGRDKRLSRAALKEINAAPAVYVSATSGFGIAIKVAKGKLKLPSPPQEWFEKLVEHHGLAVLPLELQVCI